MRALVFGAMWIILGKRVWFFPNILAEEATLKELFQFWPKKDEGERPKWTARLFYSVLAVSVILLLKHHAPDEAARARLVSLTKKYFTGMEIELSILVYYNLVEKRAIHSLQWVHLIGFIFSSSTKPRSFLHFLLIHY